MYPCIKILVFIDNAPSKSHRLSIKKPDPEKPLFKLLVKGIQETFQRIAII